MRRFAVCTICLVGVAFGFASGIASGDDHKSGDDHDGEAKYSVKQIMKIAHKDKLLNKVTSGKASAEEKTKLLDLYISMLENKPKKGDEESWHKLNGALILAAAKVTVGREGAVAELKKASNCKACHSVHK